MKKIFFSVILILSCFSSFSQGVAINTNGATADNSAMLDISSHVKGVLIPRLRTIERVAIGSPAPGLLVYDIDTRSFWYYDNGAWKEMLNSGSAILPTGPAGGDLSGTYPTPNVVKIQNLDVAPGIPFDKQIMKWDGLNNKWQGQNDSLFLPYNVTFGSPAKLFGITNANTTPGSVAIYGKNGNAGSGITPTATVGIWGDNSTGAGLLGSSNTSIGVSGLSFQNHGISGYSVANNFAGVYGSNATNGYGVMGEISFSGFAVYGRTTGMNGNAAVFENTNSSNVSDVVKITHSGLGYGLNLSLTNAASLANAINSVNSGAGAGIYSRSELGSAGNFTITNALNGSDVMDVNNSGQGITSSFQSLSSTSTASLLSGSNFSKGTGLYLGLYNASNAADGIDITHNGTGNGIYVHVTSGRAAWFDNTSITTTNDLVYANNFGKGNAGKFITSNGTNSNPGLSVTTNGTGRGLEATITNSSNAAAAVYASSSGNNGVQAYAVNTGVLGQSTALTAGVGVFGQSSLNSNDGIGVKGISYSSVTTSGSVTGNNNADGIGVFGSSLGNGGNGIGVYGKSNGTNGNGVEGESNSNSLQSGAGVYGFNSAGGQAMYGYSIGTDASGVKGLADPSNGSFGTGVVGQSFGTGDGIRGFGGGTGNGVTGYSDQNSSGNGVYGEVQSGGTGYAVKGVSFVSTKAAILGVNSSGDGVAGTTNGNGFGVRGTAGPTGTTGVGVYGSTNPISTTGNAALFETLASTNSSITVSMNNAGLSNTLYLHATNNSNTNPTVVINNSGFSNDYLVCRGTISNWARINNAGKGFFNGGTQTGGADMAEVFDVTDEIKSYEPGDVLIIAMDKDRTVERSNSAYSNLVAGVYATKPGVLMSEENIDADISGKVPMGMVGVIPTKVCLEGGEIKRGDMLVTSSLKGVAMKADIDKVKPGQIIGKALENYSANGIGKIKVLVNVK